MVQKNQKYINELQRWLFHSELNIRLGQNCFNGGHLLSSFPWPLERVISTDPGEDGVVRVVTVNAAWGMTRKCRAYIRK